MSTLNTVTISIEEYKLLITKAEAFKTKQHVYIRREGSYWDRVDLISESKVIENLNKYISDLQTEIHNLRDAICKTPKKRSWL